MSDLLHRRTFLRAALAASATWATTDILQVEDALAWAAQQPSQIVNLPETRVVKAERFLALDAMTSRIIPSVDGRPGAHEAGAAFFIDRALDTFNKRQASAYLSGLDDLNRRAAAKRGLDQRGKPGAVFWGLEAADQDAILRDIERSPFFQSVRFDTIVGTFALPTWGGNQSHAGWQLLGFDHQPRFQPPFGYYDAEIAGRG